MKKQALKDAITLAQDFINHGMVALDSQHNSDYENKSSVVARGKHAASVKRKSMDLTRALSQLRSRDN